MIKRLTIHTDGQGLYEITDDVLRVVHGAQISEGLYTVFIRHTSASLTIQPKFGSCGSENGASD